ncbi:MAG: GerMN domain-containing protein [Christensenellaceae bacterium]|jgi:germination protein M
MKRFVLVLAAAALLLAGCSVVTETEYDAKAYGRQDLVQEVDLDARITINPLLYFVSASNQNKLSAEAREIAVPQNEITEKYVVQALIDGPSAESGLLPVASGFAFEYIEVLPDVINLYLISDQYLSESVLLRARTAFCATLSDFSGKKYINIYVNGRAQGYAGMPVGTVEKTTTDISEEETKLNQKTDMESPDMSATLYFLDKSESYILPEQRSLVFKNKNYVRILVQELLKGPQNTYNHRSVIDSSISLLTDPEVVQLADGSKVLELNFNKIPIVYTEQFMEAQQMTIASLTYTLLGFLPNVDGIKILVGGKPMDDTLYTMKMFREVLGSSVTLYLPGDAYTSLYGTERVIGQGLTTVPAVLLEELMKGPAVTDDSILRPAMLQGVSMDDVRDVHIANDILVLDFKESIHGKMENVSKSDEQIMLFSIVNTLTTLDSVRRVQFLVEGERVERIGGGVITVIDPIMKNPGMIRN